MTTESSTPGTAQAAPPREAWDGIAARFDEFITPQARTLAEAALEQVGLRPGMAVLDVAAGGGALSLPAARLGARVVATDIAPGMIERLRARAHEEGLANIEARVMDGTALELEDDAFDIAASQNGVSVFPDVQRGLREMVRVTKPGGRVLVVAFGRLRNAEFLGFFMAAMQASIPGFRGLPSDPPPLPFQLAHPDTMRQALTAAGLADVRVHASEWRMEFRSANDLWNAVTSSHPIGAALVANLTPEQAADVRQVLEGMLRERSGGGPTAVLTTEVNVGIGVK